MSTNEDAERAVQKSAEKASEKASEEATESGTTTAGDELDEDKFYAHMSEEDLAEKAAKAVEDFFKTELDTSLVKTVQRLPDDEEKLLSSVDSFERFARLPKQDQEKVVESADKVYNLSHQIARFDDMKVEDIGAVIVALNTNLDAMWRSTEPRAGITAEADPTKAKVGGAHSKVTFAPGSVEVHAGEAPVQLDEPLTVVADRGELRMEGDFLVKLGKRNDGGRVVRPAPGADPAKSERGVKPLFEK